MFYHEPDVLHDDRENLLACDTPRPKVPLGNLLPLLEAGFQTPPSQVWIPLVNAEDVGVQTHQLNELVAFDYSWIIATFHAKRDRRVECVLVQELGEERALNSRIRQRPVPFLPAHSTYSLSRLSL